MLIERFDEIDALDGAIDAAFTKLSGFDPESDEYAKIVDQLTKLTKIKEILGNLKLKAFAENTKRTTDHSNLEQKDRELEHKKLEAERVFQGKMRELEARENEVVENLDIKKAELDLKLKESEKPDRVSKDALVTAGASIAGIVLKR
jgi:hypothetical protein